MMTSYIWHCFCTYCTKKYRCLLHTVPCRAQQCWKQDQKYKTKTEAGLRPVFYKTAVSDSQTAAQFNKQITQSVQVVQLNNN